MNGYPKVKAYLVENNIKQKEVADFLGITVTSFNNKLNGRGDFAMRQVRCMCKHFGIDVSFFSDHCS